MMHTFEGPAFTIRRLARIRHAMGGAGSAMLHD
jgi:hypothetical protein